MGAAGLHHVALVYAGMDAAVEQVTEIVERDRVLGTAVLVSLPRPIASEVARRVGEHEGVTFLSGEQRYARPVDAMNLLWRFTQDSLAAGARRMHAIGEIEFTGSAADEDWHWYERAVNEVYAEVPLRATCLVDLERVPTSTIGCLHATHEAFLGDVGALGTVSGAVGAAGRDVSALLPQRVVVPDRPADLVLSAVDRPTIARSAVRELLGDGATALLARAELVVSELVTNAILHGGGTAQVRCWRDDEGLTVEVLDDGPGIADVIAPLRPPSLPERGAGLWTANLESSRFHIGAAAGHGTVATARIESSPG